MSETKTAITMFNTNTDAITAFFTVVTSGGGNYGNVAWLMQNPALRAAATSTFPAAPRPPPTSISASTGSPAFRSAISPRSAAASSCSAAATPPWTAAGPRAASAAKKSPSWSAPASRR